MFITDLTKEDVLILRIVRNINNRCAYSNTPAGRAELAADCPPEIVAEVMAVWGDEPTMPEEPESPAEPTLAQETAALKRQIAETDYKIIKCSEYQLAGLPAPYDIADLHAERQALRDQINALEADVTLPL